MNNIIPINEKRCAAPDCGQRVDEEVSLVFCPVHELDYQLSVPDIQDGPASKKDAGWNVLIYKKGATK